MRYRQLYLPVIVLCLVACQTSLGQIKESVGAGGKNSVADVKAVQQLLNSVSELSGGPTTPLDVDGQVGPKTIAAIVRFQETQLGLNGGRIDPNGKTELRLLRMNGIHELLGVADSDVEKRLAEFTTNFSNIIVRVDGKHVSVRPPYHINAGRRKEEAAKHRRANQDVATLIKESVGNGGAVLGKATPGEMQTFLQAAIDAGHVKQLTPDGMRQFLAKYGISTDCSGLASRACNLLKPENPLNVVGLANTAYLAKLNPVDSPAALQPGDLMVKGGSHVRLLTDIDVTPDGIEFTTLESTASQVMPNGNGIGERRWRFPKAESFTGLELKRGGTFTVASPADSSYIYSRK